MGGWSHTEINVPHVELNPDTVTHPLGGNVAMLIISRLFSTLNYVNASVYVYLST